MISEISIEKRHVIGYALVLIVLSKEDIQLDPEQLKRKIGNMPQLLKHLPEQFSSFSPEELQAGLKAICHDLVDFAFNFTLSKKKRKNKKKK